jgi:hypothetical protein
MSPAAVPSDPGAREPSADAREWDQGELIQQWTRVGTDVERVARNRAVAKPDFALLLRFFAASESRSSGRSSAHPILPMLTIFCARSSG